MGRDRGSILFVTGSGQVGILTGSGGPIDHALTVNGDIMASVNVSASGLYGTTLTVTGGAASVGSFRGGYKRVTGGDGTYYPIAQESENIYVIGISASLTTNDVTVVLPSASIGAGHQIVIKDEWYGTRTAQYAITASVTSSVGGHGTGDMVDGDEEYYMYGSMASVTLYSDGVDKWFVV
jgi:hypothetical protein